MYDPSTPPSTPRKRARPSSTARSSTSVPKEVKQYVNAVLKRNIEIKEKSYVDNFTSTNNTGLSLVYPGQGVTNQLRIGDEIRLHSVRVRGIVANITGGTVPHYFRMMVYMSRSTGLVPFTDLFYGIPSTQIPAIVNTNFVKLLKDVTMELDVGNGLLKHYDYVIPLWNKKITFDEGTTTPEQETIHIHFFQCDSIGTPVNGSVRTTYDAILRFRDA